MWAAPVMCPALLLLAFLASSANGEGFLVHKAKHNDPSLQTLSKDFQEAVGSVLGCGSARQTHSTVEIDKVLRPIWNSVPKNRYDRVEWKLVRYMSHRFFMQKSSIMVRGFEPTRQLNTSHVGTAEILNQQVPALVDAVLDGRRAEHGFSLEDVVTLVAATEQLIFDSEMALLENVYKKLTILKPEQPLGPAIMSRLLKAYMVHWMLGDEDEFAVRFATNDSAIQETIPNWDQIAFMIEGSLKSLSFQRQRKPSPGYAHVAMESKYNIKDAHDVVGEIGRTFASYWETQCQNIKSDLVKMDKTGTGRVRLSDFYGSNLEGEWRFAESEGYLRELGALDESSSWRGPQVIIPNYLQAASNCIVARPHYLVCCVNECEDILGEVEAAIGAPLAQPADLLKVIGNMTDYNDEPAKLDHALRGQLESIAKTHGGKVPVHGRLFAQWLHYLFPRECPMPHKAGFAAAITPHEFGDNYMVTTHEVHQHVLQGKAMDNMIIGQAPGNGTEQWMSQWTEDEELPGDYSLHLCAPWEGRHGLAFGGAVMLAAALLWAGLQGSSQMPGAGLSRTVGGLDASKSHFV